MSSTSQAEMVFEIKAQEAFELANRLENAAAIGKGYHMGLILRDLMTPEDVAVLETLIALTREKAGLEIGV